MGILKQFFKQNSHASIFKILAGFGRSLNRFYENRNHNVNSNGELTVLKKLKQFNPQCIIDGGANIGKYSLLINKELPNCKIYAFEPVKSTFEKLEKNMHALINVYSINKGLFKENCTQEINIFNTDTHSSLYEIQGIHYQANQTQLIELVRGDAFMEEHNIETIDLLKLDLEGAEFDAILGFESAIKKGKIKAIQFEYGYINITTKKLLIDFYQFFEANNYVVGKIYPKIVDFRTYKIKHEDFIGPNFIAVKKSETALINSLSNK